MRTGTTCRPPTGRSAPSAGAAGCRGTPTCRAGGRPTPARERGRLTLLAAVVGATGSAVRSAPARSAPRAPVRTAPWPGTGAFGSAASRATILISVAGTPPRPRRARRSSGRQRRDADEMPRLRSGLSPARPRRPRACTGARRRVPASRSRRRWRARRSPRARPRTRQRTRRRPAISCRGCHPHRGRWAAPRSRGSGCRSRRGLTMRISKSSQPGEHRDDVVAAAQLHGGDPHRAPDASANSVRRCASRPFAVTNTTCSCSSATAASMTPTTRSPSVNWKRLGIAVRRAFGRSWHEAR